MTFYIFKTIMDKPDPTTWIFDDADKLLEYIRATAQTNEIPLDYLKNIKQTIRYRLLGKQRGVIVRKRGKWYCFRPTDLNALEGRKQRKYQYNTLMLREHNISARDPMAGEIPDHVISQVINKDTGETAHAHDMVDILSSTADNIAMSESKTALDAAHLHENYAMSESKTDSDGAEIDQIPINLKKRRREIDLSFGMERAAMQVSLYPEPTKIHIPPPLPVHTPDTDPGNVPPPVPDINKDTLYLPDGTVDTPISEDVARVDEMIGASSNSILRPSFRNAFKDAINLEYFRTKEHEDDENKRWADLTYIPDGGVDEEMGKNVIWNAMKADEARRYSGSLFNVIPDYEPVGTNHTLIRLQRRRRMRIKPTVNLDPPMHSACACPGEMRPDPTGPNLLHPVIDEPLAIPQQVDYYAPRDLVFESDNLSMRPITRKMKFIRLMERVYRH